MFLNPLKKNQQGFLLPLAIFIVVVMGLFALVISRNTIQSNTSAIQEVVSTQAFYAAESGAQRGMQILFFPNASSRQQVDSRCTSLNTTLNYTDPGLKNCTVIVTCTCVYQDDPLVNCDAGTNSNYSTSAPAKRLTSFYTVASAATCGTGNLRSMRTIDAGSFMKQE